MGKYVIKNCPAFDKQYNECHSKIGPHKLYCQDCTNCVLKQIVEKCREDWKDMMTTSFQRGLLDLLEIYVRLYK